MMFLPTLRLATLPLPPGFFAARFFAAAIRPPRVFFMPVSCVIALLAFVAKRADFTGSARSMVCGIEQVRACRYFAAVSLPVDSSF